MTSTAGRMAAERMEMPFVDLDETVARRAGASIADLWARRGEAAFRRVEAGVLSEAARLSGAVIATGGGAVLHEAAFAALAEDAVVSVLTGDPDVLVSRAMWAGTARPALEGDPQVRAGELLAIRSAAYAAAGPALDTTAHSPEEVAGELAARYGTAAAGDGRIRVQGGSGQTTVLISPGSVRHVGTEIAAAQPLSRATAVVFDPAVETVAGVVADSLSAVGVREITVPVASGEQAKTATTVADLWSRFQEAGLEPTDAVVAVGGGATLDAAGFAAATYLRGVTLVNVPTTVLAMADASFGGKVALDHGGAKNLVGTFHDPALVVVDPDVLSTLPGRARQAGMAEIVKAAVLASPILLDALEDAVGPELGGSMLTWILEQAIRIKAAFVAADPRDRGVRHSLNLGHTFAHGIEAASGYAVLHGEAVAMGLVAAARLGEAAGVTPPGLSDRLKRILTASGLPVEPPPGLASDAVGGAMLADKKRRGGRAVFVVPTEDGAALVGGVEVERAVAVLFGARRRATVEVRP